MLRWARNARGLSLRESAHALGIREQELADIESGALEPSSTVFDKMIRVYRQSESVLLLAQPPDIDPLPRDYRTAAGRRTRLSPETRLAIRDARELQRYVSELVSDDPQLIDRVTFPSVTLADDVEVQAKNERVRIGVPLATQLKWKTGDDSFNRWRDWLEKKGLLILLKKMPWKDCRGFSLMDGELLPTVVVNSEDTPAARVFTLFHEYGHLLLGNAGICQALKDTGNAEKWCNRFAAAVLLPADELRAHIKTLEAKAGPSYDWPMSQVSRLATYYRVSRPVIALRLQSLELAIPDYYKRHRNELHSFDLRPQPETPPKIVRKPGWKEKQKLREVGITAASVILNAWKEQIADATEAADILNLSLDELYGLQEQTEARRIRYVG